MNMARGAFAPHAALLSTLSGMFKDKKDKIPTPEQLNPYNFERDEEPRKTEEEFKFDLRMFIDAAKAAAGKRE